MHLKLLACPQAPIKIAYKCIEGGSSKTRIRMYGVYDRQEHVLNGDKTLGFDWLKDHRGVILVTKG